MTFGDAEVPLTYRAALWYEAGELTLTGDYDKPLVFSGIDGSIDLISILKEDPQLILRPDSSKHEFFWESTIVGKYPVKCLTFRTTGDYVNQWEIIASLTNSNSGKSVKSYAPHNSMEEVFGVTKDPETLDDSEIEDLMNKTLHEDDHKKTVDEKVETKSRQTYLIVTPNSIYKVGDALPTLLYGGIDDCQVFDTNENVLSSLILVTTPTGYILTIILNAQDTSSFVTQYWDLGSDGPWRVVRHDCNRQFLAINSKEGVLRFFEFTSSIHFEMINNLNIDNAYILDCTFFPNQAPSHFLLFVATLQTERLVYYCIEWEKDTPTLKKVHHLTYFTKQGFKRCAPIGHQKILIFYDTAVELVTANQLMSGETDFERVDMKSLGGICDTFPAPKLLKKLKAQNQDFFGRFEYCMVMGTSTGHINIAVVDSSNKIETYSLTRFKGLKSLCAVEKQNDHYEQYDIIVVSYGRTLRLSIDISQMQHLADDAPVASFSALTFKHTMDSSMEESSEIVIVQSSKISGRYISELWLTSPTSITNLQTNAPTQKLYNVCSLHQSHVFERFKIIHWDAIENDFRSRLSKMGDSGMDLYLITGCDKAYHPKSFTLNFSIGEPELVEISDLLTSEEEYREYFLTSRNAVQITDKNVYVEPLDFEPTDDSPVRFSPTWMIEGATYFDIFVLIWNAQERQVWYTANIDQLTSYQPFKRTSVFDDALKQVRPDEPVQFQIIRDDQNRLLIYMSGTDILLQMPWGALESEVCELKQICSGRIKSIISLSKGLCLIRHDGDIMAVNHSDLSIQYLDFDFDGRDIQLRKVDKDTCLIFSTQEVMILNLSNVEKWRCWFYDLRLPYQWKLNPILDVQIDNAHQRAFVSYSTGLQVFDMSYFSWNKAKYLLHSTRDPNKKFIFIKSINRMIVANFDSRKWDCIKLTDGKTRSLDATVLQEKCGPPRAIVDISNEGKEIALLLSFGNTIKLVHLLPQKGNIAVIESVRYQFVEQLFPSIEVGTNGKFYLLLIKHDDSPKSDIGTFIEANFDESRFSITNEFKFSINDIKKIKDFKLLGTDLIVNHASHNRIFILKQIFKRVVKKKVELISLRLSSQVKFSLICPLTDDSFVVVLLEEKGTSYVSELHFYHICDISSPVYTFDASECEQLDIFDRAASDTFAEIPTEIEQEREDEVMDEMDEQDAFGTPNENSVMPLSNTDQPEDSKSSSQPYRTIKLDKGVKDIKFDKVAEKLYVLATDDSVIVFRSRQDLNQTDWPNSGYEIPTPRPIAQANGTACAIGLFRIDKDGQI